MNDYMAAMREVGRKILTRSLSAPLRNTIRSFWTPEKSNNPTYLRLIRIDKTLFIISTLAVMATGAGLTLCVIGLANI